MAGWPGRRLLRMGQDLPGKPAAGPRRLQGNGGCSFNVRRDDPGELAALRDLAREEMREQPGQDRFECWERSQELSAHPRPLTESERSALRAAAAPLLADLAASGLSLPEIREEAHHEEAEASACAWIQGPGRTGAAISVRLGIPPAAQVAELAEQVQNWAADQLHDAGLPAAWPACPEHPSRPHSLEPEVRDGAAVWICGESGEEIWAIGALDVPGSGARRISKRDRRKARKLDQ